MMKQALGTNKLKYKESIPLNNCLYFDFGCYFVLALMRTGEFCNVMCMGSEYLFPLLRK